MFTVLSLWIFPLSFCLDSWWDSPMPTCFPFAWPPDTLPPAPIASDTGLTHSFFVVAVLLYLLRPRIEVHARSQIWSPVLQCAGKSCQQSDHICSKDNYFQRGGFPATVPPYHTHPLTSSLSLYIYIIRSAPCHSRYPSPHSQAHFLPSPLQFLPTI